MASSATLLRKSSDSSVEIHRSPLRNEQILRNFEIFLPKFHLILPKFYFSSTWRMFLLHVGIFDFPREELEKFASSC